MNVKHNHRATVCNADPQWVQEKIAAACDPIRKRQVFAVVWRRLVTLLMLGGIVIEPSIPLAVIALAWIIWTEANDIQLASAQVDAAHAVRLAYLCHGWARKEDEEVYQKVDDLSRSILGKGVDELRDPYARP